jgi:glycosyltransferase involved in cell wall biosynthesis
MARVSIGMPVFGGERFIRDAIDSVLAQTYGDWELLVSDNASTDATAAIAREYAARDSRIRVVVQPENLGAAPNFNFTFHETTGEFFMWLPHDDAIRPTWLERCVAALDADSGVELVYGQELSIDGEGAVLGEHPYLQPNARATARERMATILNNDRGSPAIFGLMRRATLQRTNLIGAYDASDQVLLVDLALQGKIVEFEEWLFLHREHGKRSVDTHPDRHAANAWFATRNRGKRTFPEWRLMTEYLRVIGRAPLPKSERWSCFVQFLRWAKWRGRHRRLWEDLVINFGGRS